MPCPTDVRCTPWVLVAVALAGAGCSYERTCSRPSDYVPVNSAAPKRDFVRVAYLGSGGVLIARGHSVVLTAPLYSNPTVGEIAFQSFVSDQRLVDAYLRRYAPDLVEAKAIVVGHSHYDHLMDVPRVAERWSPTATVYGNDAMKLLLAPLASLQPRLVSVEHDALAYNTPEAGGPPVRVSPTIRLWPILSEHSPQFAIPGLFGLRLPAVHLWRGQPALPASELPHRGGDWSEGTTLAFVIEIDGPPGARPFRVYYQDSPTRLPFGQPPAWLRDRGIDLAILCVGGSEVWKVVHPGAIAAYLRPANVLAVHWEDFLNPRPLIRPDRDAEDAEVTHAVPSSDPEAWMKRLRRSAPASARWLPCPDEWTDFEDDGQWRPVNPGTSWER